MNHYPKTRFFTSCVAAFQGGGCRAAALVGAVEEAALRGVNFLEFAGTSAGSIVAALMGAGATISDLKEIVSSINFVDLFTLAPEEIAGAKKNLSRSIRGLLQLSRVTQYSEYRLYFTHLGLHSSAKIEDWMNEKLQKLLGLKRKPLFKELKFPTWVIATDINNRDVKVWSKQSTPDDEVARAVRASCSIPGYFQPVEKRYTDGGILSNLPTFVYAYPGSRDDEPLSNRVLGFTLKGDVATSNQQNPLGLVQGLVDTVIDGALEVQLRTQPNVHVISIPTGGIRATDIDKMKTETVNELIENGKTAAKAFFEEELLRFRSNERVNPLCRDEAEMYSAILQNLDNKVQDILISCPKSDWIYKLFPAFFHWTMDRVQIRVILPTVPQEDHDEQYRRRLLRLMGISICEASRVPFTAFIFDGDAPTRAFAVAGIKGPEAKSAFAIKYSAPYDSAAIDALYSKACDLFVVEKQTLVARPSQLPELQLSDEKKLLTTLRGVRQYSGAEVGISIQEIDPDSLLALRPYVQEYKYRQAEILNRLYESKSIPLFGPAEVKLDNDNTSIAVPPVVEKSGDKHILIEGTARALFCIRHREKGKKITCVVAEGVREPLPAMPMELRYVLPATRSPEPNLNYSYFRPIENVAHPTNSLNEQPQ